MKLESMYHVLNRNRLLCVWTINVAIVCVFVSCSPITAIYTGRSFAMTTKTKARRNQLLGVLLRSARYKFYSLNKPYGKWYSAATVNKRHSQSSQLHTISICMAMDSWVSFMPPIHHFSIHRFNLWDNLWCDWLMLGYAWFTSRVEKKSTIYTEQISTVLCNYTVGTLVRSSCTVVVIPVALFTANLIIRIHSQLVRERPTVTNRAWRHLNSPVTRQPMCWTSVMWSNFLVHFAQIPRFPSERNFFHSNYTVSPVATIATRTTVYIFKRFQCDWFKELRVNWLRLASATRYLFCVCAYAFVCRWQMKI